jgi:hypothetical protein
VGLDAGLMSMEYNDTGRTSLRLFAKNVAKGDVVSVPQDGWAGSILIGMLKAA